MIFINVCLFSQATAEKNKLTFMDDPFNEETDFLFCFLLSFSINFVVLVYSNSFRFVQEQERDMTWLWFEMPVGNYWRYDEML